MIGMVAMLSACRVFALESRTIVQIANGRVVEVPGLETDPCSRRHHPTNADRVLMVENGWWKRSCWFGGQLVGSGFVSLDQHRHDKLNSQRPICQVTVLGCLRYNSSCRCQELFRPSLGHLKLRYYECTRKRLIASFSSRLQVLPC